ncbi:MAG TPA: hypothetical protein VEP49_09645 [Acidimicrobiia bacterium]|nr:hypothetical protein [Acidimicrobiia bacterium]
MAPTVRIAHAGEVPAALRELGLARTRAVLVLVGGAQSLAGAQLDAVEQLFAAVVVPVCAEVGAAVVDGGTDSGVMGAMGRARAATDAGFALVGVVAGGTVVGGRERDTDPEVAEPARFEPHHTHFVVVPGSQWGDESPWIVAVARSLAGDAPVVGLLVGGGDVSTRDVGLLVDAGYPVIALGGSGGLADALAADGAPTPSISVVDGIRDPERLRAALGAAFG